MIAAQARETLAKRILIVEDQGLIAMDLKRRLEYCGYAVVGMARTADDGIRLAGKHRPDVILMDIHLEGRKDGIEAATEVRRSLDIPVVFVTAHADNLTLDRAMQTQSFGYIVKPFGAADLRVQIEMASFKHMMDRELRTSRALLATTLRSIDEAVITTDTAGRIEFMNPGSEMLTGLNQASVRGKFITDVIPLFDPDSGQKAAHPVMTVLETKGEVSIAGEYRLGPSPDSSPLVHAVVSANRNEEELLGSVFAFRDVTTQREMEKQIEQSHKLAAISAMAGSLAHDFNNLLTIILGYADAAQSRVLGTDEALRQILKSGESAQNLCAQLLTVSERATVNAEVFDLNEVVRASEAMMRQILAEECSLQLKTSAEPLPVRSERTQIERVLINLATNARDAMEPGGKLIVATRRYESEWAELEVSDTGRGMTPAGKRRIFDPFFSSKPGKGMGLGMTIVHSIVSKWSGRIKVESEPGHGTTFRIFLPLARGQAYAGHPK